MCVVNKTKVQFAGGCLVGKRSFQCFQVQKIEVGMVCVEDQIVLLD